MADLIALIIGFTSSATVHFVGDLPISEVIVLAILPIILAIHGRRVIQREFKIIFPLLALWLTGQVMSDIYRHTPTLDWIRGDASIIFFGVDLLGLAVLLQMNDRRKIVFLVGTAVGSIFFTFINPSDSALAQPWKFGYSTGIISLTLLISSYFYARHRYILSSLLILGVAGVNLLENYRSPVGMLLLVVFLIFPIFPEKVGKLTILSTNRRSVRIAVLLVLALGAVWVATRLVDYVTSAGLISEKAKEKNEAEKKGGTLLGGRPEIQISLLAVAESPIIGHGSWSKDPKYVEMLFDLNVEHEVFDSTQLQELSSDLIPTHSHLMGAWVWAGILGAVFWLYLFWLVFKSIVWISMSRPQLAPMYLYLVLGLAWGILFSPFGLNVRMGDAVVIVIAVDLLRSASQGEQAYSFRRTQTRRWNSHSSRARLYFRGGRKSPSSL